MRKKDKYTNRFNTNMFRGIKKCNFKFNAYGITAILVGPLFIFNFFLTQKIKKNNGGARF